MWSKLWSNDSLTWIEVDWKGEGYQGLHLQMKVSMIRNCHGHLFISLTYKLSILQEILHMVKIDFIFVHWLLLILFDHTTDVIIYTFPWKMYNDIVCKNFNLIQNVLNKCYCCLCDNFNHQRWLQPCSVFQTQILFRIFP